MTELTGEPAYKQVANDLRRQIRDGSIAGGAQLLSTAQLMKTYDTSSTVIKAAINELRTEGLVVGQPGKGVYVREAGGTGSPPDGGPGFRAVMGQLDALRQELRDVNERLSAVEVEVHGDRKSERR